jgi:hypothetical protein
VEPLTADSSSVYDFGVLHMSLVYPPTNPTTIYNFSNLNVGQTMYNTLYVLPQHSAI